MTQTPVVLPDVSGVHDPHLDRSLLGATNEVLMNKCRAFVERLRDGAAPWIIQNLNDSYGNMPTDAPSFGFWVALVRFPSRLMRSQRRRITDLSPGTPHRRTRKGQAFADQKCQIKAEAGCALGRSAEQWLVSAPLPLRYSHTGSDRMRWFRF